MIKIQQIIHVNAVTFATILQVSLFQYVKTVI